MTTYTLIAYREDYSYTDRCGDTTYFEADHQIFCSKSDEEITNIWAEYAAKDNQGGNDYEFTLLINGCEDFIPDDSNDLFGNSEEAFMAERDRIDDMHRSKRDAAIAARKAAEERARQVKVQAAELENRRQAQRRLDAERAQYLALHAKFGGQ